MKVQSHVYCNHFHTGPYSEGLLTYFMPEPSLKRIIHDTQIMATRGDHSRVDMSNIEELPIGFGGECRQKLKFDHPVEAEQGCSPSFVPVRLPTTKISPHFRANEYP